MNLSSRFAQLHEIHRDAHTWMRAPHTPDTEAGAIAAAVRKYGCAVYFAARCTAMIDDQQTRAVNADVETAVKKLATRLQDVVCLVPIVQAFQLQGPGPKGGDA